MLTMVDETSMQWNFLFIALKPALTPTICNWPLSVKIRSKKEKGHYGGDIFKDKGINDGCTPTCENSLASESLQSNQQNLWICLTDVLPTKMKVTSLTTTKHDSQRTSQWQRKTHLEQPKTLGPRDNTQLEWQRQWHVSRLLIMMTIGCNWYGWQWRWWWAELAWSLKLFDTTVIVLLRNCFAPTTHTIMIFFSIPADPID